MIVLNINASDARKYSNTFIEYLEECNEMNDVLFNLLNNYLSDDEVKEFATNEYNVEFIEY